MIKVTPDIKVSKLIRMNPGLIDTLCSLSPHFRKLKNPVLRKMLAPRVTIFQAAKIGNVDWGRLKSAFEKEGVIFQDKNENVGLPEPDLNIGEIDNSTVRLLDVTPMISQGNDPLKVILDSLKTISPGGILKLVNSFVPVPLIMLLKKQGYAWNVEEENGKYITYFRKPEGSRDLTNTPPQQDFAFLKEQFQGNSVDLDVSELEMPEPMVRTLAALQNLPQGKALRVIHRKVPRLLFPELKEKGFAFAWEESGSMVEIIICHENESQQF